MTTKARRTKSRSQTPRSRSNEGSDVLEGAVLADVLLDCLGGTSLEEVERLLEGEGAATSPDEAFGAFLSTAEDVLPSLGSPLDAELWGSELLGLLSLLGLDREEVDNLLSAAIIPLAESAATPAALALLCVLSSLGSEELAPVAKAARQRLVGAGVPEPAWAGALGAPAIGRCWVYRDAFGMQESIFVTFRYGRSDHVLCVLIDHDLGGGVKDCYVADGARTLYRQLTDGVSSDPLTFLDDVDASEAANRLEEALVAPACPREPDQVRDVVFAHALLRSRYAHLSGVVESGPEAVSNRRRERQATPRSTSPTFTADAEVWQLKVTLKGTKPPIWRRVEVLGDIRLADLHDVIQEAFGWWDSHMHVFETPRGDFGVRDRELGFADERSVTLREVAARPGDRFTYTYDFGDDWEHLIVVEKRVRREPGVHYPRCTGGRRACPPEDCGGVWGYARMLEVAKDPAHEDAEMSSWLEETAGGEFDPASFDLGAVNALFPRAG